MERDIRQADITFRSMGIATKSAADDIPDTAWRALCNMQADQENTLSVRHGFKRLFSATTSGLDSPPHSFYYLRDKYDNRWRYAVTEYGKCFIALVGGVLNRETPGGQEYSAWPRPVEEDEDPHVVIPDERYYEIGDKFATWYEGIDHRCMFASYVLTGNSMNPFVFMADGKKFVMHKGGMYAPKDIGIAMPLPIEKVTINQSNLSVLISDFDILDDEWEAGKINDEFVPYVPGTWFTTGATARTGKYVWTSISDVYEADGEICETCATQPRPSWINDHSCIVISHSRELKTYRIIESGGGQGSLQPPVPQDVHLDRNSIYRHGKIQAVRVGVCGNLHEGSGNSDGSRTALIRALLISMEHPAQSATEDVWVPLSPLGGYTSMGLVNTKDRWIYGEDGSVGNRNDTRSTKTITFDANEYITGIKVGKFNNLVRTLEFITNKGSDKQWCGRTDTDGGATTYSTITVPVSGATRSSVAIAIAHRGLGATVKAEWPNVATALGIEIREDSTDGIRKALPNEIDGQTVTHKGFRAYIGDTPSTMSMVVNPDAEPDEQWFPIGGEAKETGSNEFELDILTTPKFANYGTIATAPGQSGDPTAIKLTIKSGAPTGSEGRMIKAFMPPVKLGTSEPEESIQMSVMIPSSMAYAAINIIKLRFYVNPTYFYEAELEKNLFAGAVGAFRIINISKGLLYPNILTAAEGWDSITAVEIVLIGDAGASLVISDMRFIDQGKISGVDLQWTYTYYDPETGAESDYAKPVAYGGQLTDNRMNIIIPPAPEGMPSTYVVRIYRMGGGVNEFRLVDEFSIERIKGRSYTFSDNVSNARLRDALETDNQQAMKHVRGLEICDERLWTYGGYYESTDSGGATTKHDEAPNKLRYSKRNRVWSFPSDNYLYVGNSNEEILRLMEFNGELFVFTTSRIFRIVNQGDDIYTAQSTSANIGTIGRYAMCRGARGLYMSTYDGVYEVLPSGRKISEPINQLFNNEESSGMEPFTEPSKQRPYSMVAMAYYDSKMYMTYRATAVADAYNDRTLIYDTIFDRWSWRPTGATQLFVEPETNILIAGNVVQHYTPTGTALQRTRTWPVQLETGWRDEWTATSGALQAAGVPCLLESREYDLGAPDNEKQFIDMAVDADTVGQTIKLEARFDNNPKAENRPWVDMGTMNKNGRSRYVLPYVFDSGNAAAYANSIMAVRTGIRIKFTTDPGKVSPVRLYKMTQRWYLEPPRHRNHVTAWDHGGSQGEKYWTNYWVEINDCGTPLEAIEVWVDGNKITETSEGLSTNGIPKKFYLPIGVDVIGEIARLKFRTKGDGEVKIYNYGFVTLPKAAGMKVQQTDWTDCGYPYRKHFKHVVLNLDTKGKNVTIKLWIDGHENESYTVNTSERAEIVHSFPMETFGKLVRLTVEDDESVEMYGDPLWVYDQRNPDITLADAYEQTLNYSQKKVLRRLSYVIENPKAPVTMTVYVDNVQRDTWNIPANGATYAPDGAHPAHGPYPKYGLRRIDFPPAYKGKLFRFAFASTEAFEIDWKKSEVFLRDLNQGYTLRSPELMPPATY